MGKQMTEMLKGTLEGIVLAILSMRPAYGYEITASLREQGFSDIVEGTVYALLVRIEQKKQYKQYKARIEALPEPYGTVAKALQRYFMYYGGVTDGETALTMFGDFADLWERAAADGTPVREIVGDDPVEFAETFAQAYTGKQWIDKERARLTKAIEDAERGEQK